MTSRFLITFRKWGYEGSILHDITRMNKIFFQKKEKQKFLIFLRIRKFTKFSSTKIIFNQISTSIIFSFPSYVPSHVASLLHHLAFTIANKKKKEKNIKSTEDDAISSQSLYRGKYLESFSSSTL